MGCQPVVTASCEKSGVLAVGRNNAAKNGDGPYDVGFSHTNGSLFSGNRFVSTRCIYQSRSCGGGIFKPSVFR